MDRRVGAARSEDPDAAQPAPRATRGGIACRRSMAWWKVAWTFGHRCRRWSRRSRFLSTRVCGCSLWVLANPW